jgi:hypothetical protein
MIAKKATVSSSHSMAGPIATHKYKSTCDSSEAIVIPSSPTPLVSLVARAFPGVRWRASTLSMRSYKISVKKAVWTDPKYLLYDTHSEAGLLIS